MRSILLRFSGIFLSLLFVGGVLLWDQLAVLPTFLLPLKDDLLLFYCAPALLTIVNILTFFMPGKLIPVWKTLWEQLFSKSSIFILIFGAVLFVLLEFSFLNTDLESFLLIFFIFVVLRHFLRPFPLFTSVFGDFQYQFPRWIREFTIKNLIYELIKHFKSQGRKYLSFIILCSFAAISYYAYLNRTQTVTVNKSDGDLNKSVNFSLWKPGISNYEEDGNGGVKVTPRTLSLQFNGAVAPIKLIGKELKKNLPRINPKIEGIWKWSSDSLLLFEPKNDWKYAETYRVELHELEYSRHFEFDKTYATFQLPGLDLNSKSSELYIDPKDPRIIKGIFNISFNYPINREVFKEHISVIQKNFNKEGKEIKETPLKFSLVFQDLRRGNNYDHRVFIHSQQIKIPDNSGKILIKISKGLKDLKGKTTTDYEISDDLSLPGMRDFFKVEDMGLRLVENNEGVPAPIVHLALSLGIKAKEFNDYFEVMELPLEKEMSHPSIRNKTIAIKNWKNHSSRIPELKNNELKKVQFTLEKSPERYPKSLIAKIKSSPRRYYLVRVKKGLKSASGHKLFDDVERVFQSPAYPKKLKFMNSGNILSLKGSKKINILGLNRKSYRVEVGMLIKNQVQHLLSQSTGDFRNPNFRNYNFSEENITYKKVVKFDFKNYKENSPLYGVFDFEKYLYKTFKGKSTEGVFFVKLTDTGRYPKVLDKRLIVVSDLGVVIKKDKDGRRNFFIQSLKNGRALNGVKIEAISANGLTQRLASTDGDGFASIVLPKKEESGDRVIGTLISKGRDKIFMKIDDYGRRLDMSRFMTGGVYRGSTENSLKAFLFSDRGIYRPGETIRLGSIVKDEKFKQGLKGIPVFLVVNNSRGKKIIRLESNLRKSGLNSFEFSIGENAPTGEYQASLYTYLGDKRKRTRYLGGITFKVEEFLPDRLKIQTRFNSDKDLAWVKTDNLKGIVTLKNLFGFPAIGHEIRGLVKITNKSLYFGKYRDFRFDNPTKNFSAYSEELSVEKTNAKGEVEFSLPVEKFANKIFQLNFFVEGFEKEGGRSVNGVRSLLVSPFETLIGLKASDDYSFIKKEQKKFIEYVAIDSKLKQLATRDFSLAFYERRVLNVLIKRPNGTFGYESIIKDVLIKKEELSFNSGKELRKQLDTSRPGDYRLIVMDSNEIEFSRFDYTVVGKRDLSRSLARDVELKIKLETHDISPGEVLKFELRSGYKGAGLITIETDRVVAKKWFKQDAKTRLHSIRVPRDVEGNAYLNVTLLRDSRSKEIYTNPLSYGVMPFSLNKDARKNKVELDIKGIHKPGEFITVNYRSKRRGDIILYAVDEGILQFAKYRAPRPLDFFFKKKALEVVTFQLLDLLLPEYEQVMRSLAPGGGFGAISQNVNPFKRKKKKPVAFWSGVIKSGPQFKKWRFQVPDYFNGNIKFFAVAVNPERIGVEKSESYVRADLIVTPTVATYLSPGDVFKVPLTVFNNTPSDNGKKPVTVTLKADLGLSVSGHKTIEKSIARESDTPFSFAIKALDKLGNQNLKFTAFSGSYKNSVKESLSIRPSSPYLDFYSFGIAKPGSINIDEGTKYYKQFYKGELSVGLTPTKILKPFLTLLSNNPYGCTEQLLSKAYPLLIQWDSIKTAKEKRELASYIQRTVSMLYGRSLSDGRIGLYQSGSRSDDFLLLYAIEFLLDARDRDIFVSESFLNGLISTLKKEMSDFSLLYRAHALYLLVKAQQVPGVFLVELEEEMASLIKKEKSKVVSSEALTLLYLAGVYSELGDVKKSKALIRDIDFVKTGHVFHNHYYSYTTQLMKSLFLVAKYYPEYIKDIPDSFLIDFFNSNKNYFTTLATAESLRAMYELNRVIMNDVKMKMKVIGVFKNETGKDQKMTLEKANGVYVIDEKIHRVTIENGSDKPLYYSFMKSGFPQKALSNISKGIEVSKEIKNLDGSEISTVTIGDEIEVIVSFRSTKAKSLNDLALVDLYPGGFESVLSNEGRASIEQGVKSDFVDVREDRVISYGGANESVTKLTYRLKAINVGEFTVPPAKIEDMYNKDHIAIGEPMRIKVVEKK